MTLTGVKFIISDAEEKVYQKKVIKKVKDQNGKEVDNLHQMFHKQIQAKPGTK